MFRKILKAVVILFAVGQILGIAMYGSLALYLTLPALKEADISIIQAIRGDVEDEKAIELERIMKKRSSESGKKTAQFIIGMLPEVKVPDYSQMGEVNEPDFDKLFEEIQKHADEGNKEGLRLLREFSEEN